MRISDWSSDVCSSDLDPLMRRWIFGLLALLLMAAAAFFLLAPGIIERGVNKVEGGPLPQVGEQARALHRTLAIVDLHSDTLLWKRDLLTRAGRGHVDLPRLEDGHVALQIFSSVPKTPQGQNYDANRAASYTITGLAIAPHHPLRPRNSPPTPP